MAEAEAIIRKNRHPSAWRLIISSTKENEAFSAELSGSGVEVIPIETMGRSATNSAVTNLLQRTEYSTGYNYYADSRLRQQNLQLVLRTRLFLNLQEAVDLISSERFFDSRQNGWGSRAPTGTIAKRSNVQSLVFAPERRLIYLGVSDIPGARSLDGIYIPFSSEGARLPQEMEDTSPIHRSHPYLKHSVEANAYYRRAAILLGDEANYRAGYVWLDRAMATDPSDAIYPMMAGLSRFMGAWNIRNPNERSALLAEAIGFLRLAASLDISDYHFQVIRLFEARYALLEDNRELATRLLNSIDTAYSTKLKKAVQSAKLHGYDSSKLKTIVLDFMNMDVMSF